MTVSGSPYVSGFQIFLSISMESASGSLQPSKESLLSTQDWRKQQSMMQLCNTLSEDNGDHQREHSPCPSPILVPCSELACSLLSGETDLDTENSLSYTKFEHSTALSCVGTRLPAKSGLRLLSQSWRRLSSSLDTLQAVWLARMMLDTSVTLSGLSGLPLALDQKRIESCFQNCFQTSILNCALLLGVRCIYI